MLSLEQTEQTKRPDKAVSAQRLRTPAVTQAAIRDPFISPAHLTKPEGWPLLEGPYTKGRLISLCRNFKREEPTARP